MTTHEEMLARFKREKEALERYRWEQRLGPRLQRLLEAEEEFQKSRDEYEPVYQLFPKLIPSPLYKSCDDKVLRVLATVSVCSFIIALWVWSNL